MPHGLLFRENVKQGRGEKCDHRTQETYNKYLATIIAVNFLIKRNYYIYKHRNQ